MLARCKVTWYLFMVIYAFSKYAWVQPVDICHLDDRRRHESQHRGRRQSHFQRTYVRLFRGGQHPLVSSGPVSLGGRVQCVVSSQHWHSALRHQPREQQRRLVSPVQQTIADTQKQRAVLHVNDRAHLNQETEERLTNSMKQFYLLLLSDSDKNEFPQKKPNHFKNR